MPLHKLLQSQLKKFDLQQENLPTSVQTWQGLLNRVSSHYKSQDEDIYLLERSLRISGEEARIKQDATMKMANHLSFSQKILEDLLNGVSLINLIERIINEVDANSPGFFSAFFLFNENTQELELLSAPKFADNIKNKITRLPVGPDSCPCGVAAYDHKLVCLTKEFEARLSEQYRSLFNSLNLHSCTAIPIIDQQNKVLGVLGLYSQEFNLTLSEAAYTAVQNHLSIINVILTHLAVKRRLEEEQLIVVAKSKMASLGEMAGGVAHEINNPLLILSGLVEMLVIQAESDTLQAKQVIEVAHRLSHTIDRISKIVKNLRSFSREGSADPKENRALQTIIDEVAELSLQRFKNSNTQLIVPSHLDYVLLCRPVQISQVLINFLNNSLDAIADLDERWVEVKVSASDEQVKISIIDSGKGIPIGLQQQLFKPFYTTKASGKGTGLGLSISRKIIEEHGGTIRYNSGNPNTEFIIELPLAGVKRLPLSNEPHPPFSKAG